MAISEKSIPQNLPTFGAFLHEILLHKLHWIFLVVKMMKICPKKNASCMYR
jgi:hypothetical protein